ncbi:hypothetical protein NDU88_003576 [Pleurodeles waltl]|uniref:Uncharacterized protein n=1 Tax=Pleurodeles waltl TaxID=8319 RepID=A0AAV7RGA2_PLEWA|nr:hypothetical protein NDU88_003576 [Pleurodeles waltl]
MRRLCCGQSTRRGLPSVTCGEECSLVTGAATLLSPGGPQTRVIPSTRSIDDRRSERGGEAWSGLSQVVVTELEMSGGRRPEKKERHCGAIDLALRYKRWQLATSVSPGEKTALCRWGPIKREARMG